AVTFDAGATKVVSDLSRGLPRRVNVLCDRALQEGRIAGHGTITPELVKRAARALAGAPRDSSTDEDGTTTDDPNVDLPVGTWRWMRGVKKLALVATVGLLLAAGGLSYGYYARNVLNTNPGIPDAPHGPKLLRAAADPAPAPSDAEVTDLL